ncbi:MAG: Fe-S cluster assembly ATPase SufC [Gammaproteobacteria bacterium]|nr:Fe-S cluster assembly ATPase SufC [Gammaproteobacteria bacterium]MXX94341.1 Fe-S cluster assembly ATPase SufC [Gammaproteobacteria bacterium]MYF53084.1 Fe-S cluster assembly ATPase SufC [Gammaproteobacteria bacterium]MYK43269.1 Fe-S cluster assembly ATPase SufC [Gammaproteobacteria bacterium]
MTLLDIVDLHISVEEREIIKGIDLQVEAGEIHAIMGPNGSGKSTLTNALAGQEGYQINHGSAHLEDKDLLELSVEERARAGLFLAFQYPVELPGVSNVEFLKTAVDSLRRANGLDDISTVNFMKELRQLVKKLDLDPEILKRGVNEGFSGGERKRNEIVQLLCLKPRVALLDETDSGLDIDALQTVARGIKEFRSPRTGIVLVTHYQRLLEFVQPDYVHVMLDGRLVRSGDASLALELEAKGYAWLEN